MEIILLVTIGNYYKNVEILRLHGFRASFDKPNNVEVCVCNKDAFVISDCLKFFIDNLLSELLGTNERGYLFKTG